MLEYWIRTEMTVRTIPDVQPGLEVIDIDGEFELIHEEAEAVDKVVDVGDVVGLDDFLPVLDALVGFGAFREVVEQGAMAEAEHHDPLPLVLANLTAVEHGRVEGKAESPEEVVAVLDVAEAVEGEHDGLGVVLERLRACPELTAEGLQLVHEGVQLLRAVGVLLEEPGVNGGRGLQRRLERCLHEVGVNRVVDGGVGHGFDAASACQH